MPQDIRHEIISIVDELYDGGLITPKGGNVSARVPDAEELWITPTQLYKGGLTEETLIRVNMKGRKLEGRDRPSVELPMHLQVYKTRDDVGAVIHTHAPMATIAVTPTATPTMVRVVRARRRKRPPRIIPPGKKRGNLPPPPPS